MAPSTSTCGSSRSSQRGSHQFRSPSSDIVAGTSTSRMTVASRKTATARPSPIILTTGSLDSVKARKTLTMMAAAAVMTRAVAVNPRTTLPRLSPPSRHSSRNLESRNTSYYIDRPNTIANISIGTTVSSGTGSESPTSCRNQPQVKTATVTPSAAAIESRLSNTALSGTSTDRNTTISSRKDTANTAPTNHGSRVNTREATSE